MRPVLPAVGRIVETAVGSEGHVVGAAGDGLARRGTGIDDVEARGGRVAGAARIDDDASDGSVHELVEAQGRRPVTSAVRRHEDAAAAMAVAGAIGLAGADVNDAGVDGVDGDGADGLALDIFENRAPGLSAVGGLPHAAVGGARIDDVTAAGVGGGWNRLY